MATMFTTTQREVFVVPTIDVESSQEHIARITARAFDLLPGGNEGERRGALLRVSDRLCVIAGIPTAAQQAEKLEAMRAARRAAAVKPVETAPSQGPIHPMVYCSQCGRGFGPGNHGFSHCANHKGRKVVES